MSIEKPIIIFGTGRCGSTLLHKILSYHPDIMFLTKFAEMYPNNLKRNAFLVKVIRDSAISPILKESATTHEAYHFWNYHTGGGFAEPYRDLVASDLTDQHRLNLLKNLNATVTKDRDRLLIKVTGWGRLGFLNKLFPDARFIHIVRDSRAVANSLLNVGFWTGWYGPDRWRWGKLDPELHALWEKYDQSFLALAVIQWKMLVNSYCLSREVIDDNRFLQITYDDFCTNYETKLKTILDFCELERSPVFDEKRKHITVDNKDEKWKQHLTEEQQEMLKALLNEEAMR